MLCSKEYIEAKDDLLCREMFCRMQQRGSMRKPHSRIILEISNPLIQKSFKDRVKTLREMVCERHVLIYSSKESKKILALFSLYDNVLVLTNNTRGNNENNHRASNEPLRK